MKKAVERIFWVVACMAVTSVPALAQTQTPEPTTIWLVAGAGGALLVIRQLRKRK